MDSGKTDRVVVELLSGHAEIFGTEMVAHNKYQVIFFDYLATLILTNPPFHSFKEEPSLQCSLSRGAGCRLALNYILEQLEFSFAGAGKCRGGTIHQQGDPNANVYIENSTLTRSQQWSSVQ